MSKGELTAGAEATGRYYDAVQWLYNLGWRAGGTRSLHYGLWWDDTRDLGDAIRNGDRFIADKLGLGPEDHVLDMGCGVGGTSIFLAQTYGCRVTGITVSSVQLRRARENAARAGLGDDIDFALMDYTAMSFPSESFTKAFTLEAGNYALHKIDMLREVQRVLKPGGRYVALDPFSTRAPRDAAEEERLRRVMRGWSCPGYEPFERTLALAEEAGLRVVEHGDLNRHFQKSAKIIWRAHVLGFPFVYLARLARLVPRELLWHFQASLQQKELLCAKDNLLMLGYFVGEKPIP